MLRTLRTLPALAALLAACTAPAAAPDHVELVDEVEAHARIVAIDRDAREFVVENDAGERMTVLAGPVIRNFDQLEVGDTITSRYTIALHARKLADDEADTEEELDLAAARAAEGDKPGAGIGAGMTMTVVVKTVDRETHVVTFTDPAGNLRAVEAQRDEGRAFVDGLKPGDRIEISYVEASAISVE